ncbi:DUF4435 domain-containing protein [Lactococcus sp. S47]|uniref:DUF4435 domain-containing protein n=1 Tax=Lactococcus sp. S47 TaxID=2767460 RepID=UPI0019069F67|nr:DUF4435 domain-containing protein [Lactococcus sp. S47]MBK0028827.1 DUF4435 domain-containing protein [Lactococcus sp. S47]
MINKEEFLSKLNITQQKVHELDDFDFNNIVNRQDLEKIYKEKMHRFEEICPKLNELIEKKSDFSAQLESVFSNSIVFNAPILFSKYSLMNANGEFQADFQGLISIVEELTRIYYLTLVDSKLNSVIVGANGSGKTSFANYFRQGLNRKIAVIPARKNLFTSNSSSFITTSVEEVRNQVQTEDLKHRSNYGNDDNFSKLITALVNEYVEELVHEHEQREWVEKDIFTKFTRLFNLVIPDITLNLNVNLRTFSPSKRGYSNYNLDDLSDGEKVIIYHIIQVLLAVDESTIIIDEPEIYLNSSIYNRLWTLLEQERPDCRFIYIAHSVDFIESRTNANFIWCKGFDFPSKWEIELLGDDFFSIPKSLLIQLSGAKKDIIFCEGENQSSIDYIVYSALFPEQTVIPVGDSREVIKWTKNYNSQDKVFLNHAVGIVDHDLRTDEEISDLAKKNVFSTEFLEIEMLLCDKEVMKSVILVNYPKEIESRIDAFKEKFRDKLNKRRPVIVSRYIKKVFEQEIHNVNYDDKIDFQDNIAGIVNNLSSLQVKQEEFSEYLGKILENFDYEAWLKVCTLQHKEILSLADSTIDRDYQKKAINHIVMHVELQESLKNKYFKEVVLQ